MKSAHSVAQVRAAEAELLAVLPEGALMERAAAGLAAAIVDFVGRAYGVRVLLLVGSGDNGGDALIAGALLLRRGMSVEAVLLADNAQRTRFEAAGGRVVTPSDAQRPDVIIDGIVGIGGRPGLRADAVSALGLFPDAPVVAVDVPSGVEVDTGALPEIAARAELTVTFGTHKVAHLVDPAAQRCGAVELIDLGLSLPTADVVALQAHDVAALLHWPGPFDHKYTRGVVGLRTGSSNYPGAGVLSVAGAVSGLCGMVRYDGDAPEAIRSAHAEVVVGTGRVQAWVVGSGSGEYAEDALADSLEDGAPVVVDADALSFVKPGDAAVLTPHAGELAAMLGVERAVVEATPLRWAREAASSYDAVVLLKGRRTVIAHPDGRVRVTTTGIPWLAVAGAGDVLAGVIGALLASGLAPYDAASVGSWLHGAAATAVGGPLRAREVADAIPAVVHDLEALRMED